MNSGGNQKWSGGKPISDNIIKSIPNYEEGKIGGHDINTLPEKFGIKKGKSKKKALEEIKLKKTHKSFEGINKKQKWYTYTVKEDKEGNETIRNVTNKNNLDEVFRSKIKPTTRKDNQSIFDDWKPHNRGFMESDYTNLVRSAQLGGKKSSRKLWANNAEKQLAKRAKSKWLTGKALTKKEKKLLTKAGYDSESDK